MGMLLLRILKYNQVRELSIAPICLFRTHQYSSHLAVATFRMERLLKRREECWKRSTDSLRSLEAKTRLHSFTSKPNPARKSQSEISIIDSYE